MDDTGRMVGHLVVEGPDPRYASELELFGRLVGSWNMEMTSIDPDGGRRSFIGEWHFGWVLGGRAVQDVLITRSPEGDLVGYGSTVRSFDPGRGLWWVVWQDPLAGEFSVLLAREVDDRIVLDGRWTIGDGGRSFRWTFSHITPESFRWECHVLDNGSDWRLVEEMEARRVPGGP